MTVLLSLKGDSCANQWSCSEYQVYQMTGYEALIVVLNKGLFIIYGRGAEIFLRPPKLSAPSLKNFYENIFQSYFCPKHVEKWVSRAFSNFFRAKNKWPPPQNLRPPPAHK